MEFAWVEARHLKTNEKTFLIVGPRDQIVGRASAADSGDKLAVAFDASLSRQHFHLQLVGDRLRVERCPEARRPLFFEGRAEEKFEIACGEGFSSGQTLFRWIREANPSGAPIPLDPTLLSVAHEQDASRGLRALLALQPVLRDFETTEALIRGTLSVLGEVISQAADLMAIQVDTQGQMKVLASQGNSQVPPSRTLVRQALEAGKPLCHLWQNANPEGAASPTVVEGISWAVAAPILGRDESYVLYAIGAEVDGDPGELDRAVLALVAEVVASALEKSRRLLLERDIAAERERRGLAEQLGKLQQGLLSTLNPEEVAKRFLVGLENLVLYDRAALLQQEGESYRLLAHRGFLAESGQLIRPEEIRSGLPGWLEESHTNILLVMAYRQSFDEPQLMLARALASQAYIALQNARLHQRVQQLATQDGLTGVFNRRHFMEEADKALATCRQQKTTATLFLIDVDHFKQFNDQNGHLGGDQALRQAAQQLQETFRPGLFGRYGGEEFVALCPVSGEAARQLAERARQRLQEHGQLTVSVGFSSAGSDFDTLVGQADRALYHAKEQGRNRVVSA
ncbi:MAG: GGDEF domain-containing protein [Candidatus Eremiobacteraeota bacterium]|nr:GGDEF domain-containing protein [Candidatus Eremiobacteraeota bacterium]MCW5867738.1 GGDEF domain-containing protein [Candidatus Eremiobacteraeota bacterium]